MRFFLSFLLLTLVLGAPRPDLLAAMLVNVAETEEDNHGQRTTYLEQQTRLRRRCPAPPERPTVIRVEIPRAELPPRPPVLQPLRERLLPRVSQGPPSA